MIVTKPAPEFKTQAVMPDNSIQEVKLSDYKGKKVVLFFYPLDFTFVCPTELLAFDKRLSEFESRGVQVLGCSVDSRWSHLAWKNTDVNKGGIGNVQYPILQDLDKSIARSFDVLVGSTPATVYTQDKELDFLKDGRKNKVFNKKINSKIPVFLIHGKKDDVVPLRLSRKIFSIFPKAKKKMEIVKGGDHSLSRKGDLNKLAHLINEIIC